MVSGGYRIGSGTKRDDSTEPAVLYRHFNAAGVLLYVGVTVNPLTRLAQHGAKSDWWPEIANITLQQFETRSLARDAERAAIRLECPRYNIHGTPASGTIYLQGGKYYIAKIHIDGRQKYLGCFSTAEEASAAVKAANDNNGEFARTG